MAIPPPSAVAVALIRGINVGGRGRVPMADLRRAIEALGCEDVRTYVQSGNVVLLPPAALGTGSDLATALAGAVRSASGVETVVIVRTAEELAAIVAACPFPEPDAAGTQHHVAFLAEEPDAAAAAALDPDRSPPDALVLRGREVYLHLPSGAGKTRITGAWLERQLGTAATARNWNTVLALLALAQGGEAR